MYPLRAAGLPFVPIKGAATLVLKCRKYLRTGVQLSPVPGSVRLAISLLCRMTIPPPCTEKYPFSIAAMTRISFWKVPKNRREGCEKRRKVRLENVAGWASGNLGTQGVDAVKAVARGERIDRVFRKLGQAGIDDVRERLKIAEMVAPFIPGLGTGVAAALGAANALAAGKPITEALLSAARSAIPGGKLAQVGFDVAMNLARGKSLSESALSAARSQLPGGRAAQAAFDTGLALAQGKKLQHAAFAATGRLLPPSPFAAGARSFARAVANGKTYNRLHCPSPDNVRRRGKRFIGRFQTRNESRISN